MTSRSCPGGIFSRAFVRSYAVEVGLDPDETVREFLERFQGEPSPSATVQIAVPEEESTFESQQRMASVVLKLVLISIPLVGVILYFTHAPPAGAEPPCGRGRRAGCAAAGPAVAAAGSASVAGAVCGSPRSPPRRRNPEDDDARAASDR